MGLKTPRCLLTPHSGHLVTRCVRACVRAARAYVRGDRQAQVTQPSPCHECGCNCVTSSAAARAARAQPPHATGAAASDTLSSAPPDDLHDLIRRCMPSADRHTVVTHPARQLPTVQRQAALTAARVHTAQHAARQNAASDHSLLRSGRPGPRCWPKASPAPSCCCCCGCGCGCGCCCVCCGSGRPAPPPPPPRAPLPPSLRCGSAPNRADRSEADVSFLTCVPCARCILREAVHVA